MASNRKGGIRCKPTDDENIDKDDDSDDADAAQAIASSKKTKKIRVKGNQNLFYYQQLMFNILKIFQANNSEYMKQTASILKV